MKLPLALCPPFSAAEDKAHRPASAISSIEDMIIALVNRACPRAAPETSSASGLLIMGVVPSACRKRVNILFIPYSFG
jgi:hypothetical protein